MAPRGPLRSTQALNPFGPPAKKLTGSRSLYELANYQILRRALQHVPYLSPTEPGCVLTTFAFISAAVEALMGIGDDGRRRS